MLKILSFLKVGLVILLCLDVFMWMVFNGSGHKISLKTNWTLGLYLLYYPL
jgi:hypothetical protein